MACPVCEARHVVRIGLKVGAADITMHSCSKCDTRWWHRDGEEVDLSGVLEIAASR